MEESNQQRADIVSTINDLKGTDPFQPFEMVLTSGTKYAIESPGNLVELRTQFFYAFPGGERWVWIRKVEIAAIEGSEGKPRRTARRRRAS